MPDSLANQEAMQAYRQYVINEARAGNYNPNQLSSYKREGRDRFVYQLNLCTHYGVPHHMIESMCAHNGHPTSGKDSIEHQIKWMDSKGKALDNDGNIRDIATLLNLRSQVDFFKDYHAQKKRSSVRTPSNTEAKASCALNDNHNTSRAKKGAKKCKETGDRLNVEQRSASRVVLKNDDYNDSPLIPRVTDDDRHAKNNDTTEGLGNSGQSLKSSLKETTHAIPRWIVTKEKSERMQESENRLIKDIACIQSGEISLIYGAPGCGKSTWMRIFAGRFLDADHEHAVLYLTENPTTIHRDMDAITKNTAHFYPANASEFCDKETFNRRLDDTFSLARSLKGGTLLIVIDTLTKFSVALGKDTNTPKDMAEIMLALGRLRDECTKERLRVAIVLVYHSQKSNPKQYKGASEISSQSNSRHWLSKQEGDRTLIETISGQSVNAGEIQAFKMEDKVNLTTDFDMYTSFTVDKENQAAGGEVTKSMSDMRKAYGALLIGMFLSENRDTAKQSDIERYAGFGDKKAGNLAYKLFTDGVIRSYKHPIKLPWQDKAADKEVDEKNIQDKLNAFSIGYNLPETDMRKLGLTIPPNVLELVYGETQA